MRQIDYLILGVIAMALIAAIYQLESNVNGSVSKIAAIEARLARLERLEIQHHGSP